MAFTTDPPFCTAYPLSFVHEDNPAQMTFRSQQNHPVSFTEDGLLVHQLLAWDCPLHKYVMDRHHGRLLIPRRVHFLPNLFPPILIPHNHVTPYRDPQTGEEAPFVTVGPFVSMDTLFHGTAGDLELYTAKEVIALRNAGVFKSSKTPVCLLLNYHHSLIWGRLCLPLQISNCLTTASRWNQTHLPGNETTEVLQGVTGALYPWLLDIMKTWISQNMNVRLPASNSIKRSMPSVGEEIEVESVRSAIAPKAGICTMGTPLNMSVVPYSSVADLLTLVHPVIIPI